MAESELITRYGSGARQFEVDGISVLVGQTSGATRLEPGSDEDKRVALVAQALCLSGKAFEAHEQLVADLHRRLGDALREVDRVRALVPPKVPARIMATGCVRFDERGGLWLLSKRETGWAAFGVWVSDWDNLFRRYNVRVTDHGTDATGPWWAVENCSKETSHV